MSKRNYKMIKDLQRRGWEFVRHCGTGHILMRYRNGLTLTLSSTPSDGRALRNQLADIRRIEEGRTTNQKGLTQ